MSRWAIIDDAAVKTGKNSAVLSAVRAKAVSNGDADPLPEYIADTVATLRSAVSVANQLDADATKIPKGLKGLALRMILRRCYSYLELPLSTDDSKQADEDKSYLIRIIDARLKFEMPDNADGSAEMQENGMKVEAVNVPARRTGRDRNNGL